MSRTIMSLPALVAIIATVFFCVEADITSDYGTCVEKQLTIDEIQKHPTHPRRRQRTSGFVPPSEFDAATKWPNCLSIRTIRDQGSCGTCWAVSSASVIADRRCIVSGQQEQDFISSTRFAGCVYPSKTPDQNCIVGGDKSEAFQYAVANGGATGGEYGSNAGCLPYFTIGDATPPISCPSQCSNSNYSPDMNTDAGNHPVGSYWMVYDKDMSVQANIDAQVLLMQEEIMTNGPIGASLFVDDAFQSWSAGMEPFSGASTWDPSQRTCTTNHAIRLTGWGVSDQGTRYWTIANSWSARSGDNGYFRIAMGVNSAGIECKIAAPVISGAGSQPSQDDPTGVVTDAPAPTDPGNFGDTTPAFYEQ